jgi:hypothetical protein
LKAATLRGAAYHGTILLQASPAAFPLPS